MVEWGKAAAATIVAAAMAAAMPCAAGEAIAIGEDILRNGVLLPGGDGYPPEWDLSYECRIGRNAFFEPVGGAGAAGPASHAVRFAAQGWKPRTLTLRQFDIKLSTAGVYRLSGRIRTRGLRCRSSGLVVADSGWENDYGVSPLPADTGGEWREVAAEVRLSPSADGLYSVAFYAQGLAAGELEMSDCRLVALDAEAAAEFFTWEGSASVTPGAVSTKYVSDVTSLQGKDGTLFFGFVRDQPLGALMIFR